MANSHSPLQRRMCGRAYTAQDHLLQGPQYKHLMQQVEEARENLAPAVYLNRTATREDRNFVIDSWSSSYRHGAASDKIAPDIYKVEQRARISRILAVSKLRVMYEESAPSHISGWICFSPPSSRVRYPILHYLLVHTGIQMKGLSANLLAEALASKSDPEDPMWCTHWTLPMRKLIPRWNLIFNPYLLELLK